jgi:hypothetical protein
VAVGGVRQLPGAEPRRAVVEVHAQRRREAGDLGTPLLDDAHRADDERRAQLAAAGLLALGGDHRNRLHRLAEAHVVRKDRADAEVPEQPQPAVATLLEREERVRHRRRCRQGAEAPLVGVEQRRERLVERDVAELDAGRVRLEPGDGAHELHDPGAGAAPVEEAKRLLHVRLLQRLPAAVDADERLLRGGELDQLLLGQLRVPDRQPPVEACEVGLREEAARAAARQARRGQVHAHPRRRAQPRRRQQHRNTPLVKPRHPLAEKAAHLLLVELELGRLRRVECDPELAQQRLERAELAVQVGARVAGAEEGEDVAVARPQQRGGQTERGIVCGLEPELEHQPALVALVEVEPERPGRAVPVREPRVHPFREPSVQRREPGVARERGVGRGQAPEEEVEGGAAARAFRGEADAVRAEPVAGDLVDEDGIEVVDGLGAVAAEGAGTDGRQRAGDDVERGGDALVESCAPERVPPAAVVLERGMHEALGDRPLRQPHDRKDGSGAGAQRQALRRRLGQGDQLRRLQPARGDAAARECDVGDRGQAEPEPTRRERAVAAALEEQRGRVLLPDDLEGR